MALGTTGTTSAARGRVTRSEQGHVVAARGETVGKRRDDPLGTGVPDRRDRQQRWRHHPDAQPRSDGSTGGRRTVGRAIGAAAVWHGALLLRTTAARGLRRPVQGNGMIALRQSCRGIDVGPLPVDSIANRTGCARAGTWTPRPATSGPGAIASDGAVTTGAGSPAWWSGQTSRRWAADPPRTASIARAPCVWRSSSTCRVRPVVALDPLSTAQILAIRRHTIVTVRSSALHG